MLTDFKGSTLASTRVAQPACDRLQAIKFTARGIRPFIQPGSASVNHQRIRDHVFEPLYTACQKLRHQRVAIPVHDQAWQAIRFTMNQAQAITFNTKTSSCVNSTNNVSYQKRSINSLLFVKTPDPRPNFGLRADRRPPQKLPGSRLYPHGFTSVATAFGNSGLKYPRVMTQQRTFFAIAQSEGFHLFLLCARGWAASYTWAKC